VLVRIGIIPLFRRTYGFGSSKSVDSFLVNDFFQSHHLNKYILISLSLSKSTLNKISRNQIIRFNILLKINSITHSHSLNDKHFDSFLCLSIWRSLFISSLKEIFQAKNSQLSKLLVLEMNSTSKPLRLYLLFYLKLADLGS
jgi:hypothetical protein